MTSPKDFVEDQFLRTHWNVIPTVLKTAYAAAEDIAKDIPILNVQSALDNKGRLVAWAVDFGIERAIKNGSLRCDFRWKSFARPTGRYLELIFSHSTASISQIADATKQPRNVVFRENARLSNQGILDIPQLRREQDVSGEPHFLLVHGYKSLDFAHLAVPDAHSKTKYIWQSENLLRLPHEITSSVPEAEDTDFDLDELNLLKEDIEKWKRENE